MGSSGALASLISGIGYELPPQAADTTQGPKLTETVIMLAVLGLIDVVMISNLLIMVIVGGYETFVSRMGLEGHPDEPEWLSHVNASVLKVKLGTAIIGISSIHLLKTFINAEHTPDRVLIGQTVIHIAFLLSAIAIAYTDKLPECGRARRAAQECLSDAGLPHCSPCSPSPGWRAGHPGAHQRRRRPLRHPGPADAAVGRLDHTALERPALLREAAASVLGRGGVDGAVRRERVLGPALGPGSPESAPSALVGLTARRLWGAQAGIDALFIAAATTWIVGNSHFLSLDAGLTCALTLVLCGVLVAERVGLETPAATRWVLAAWVGMALGVLSKGPIAVVIPGAVLVLHSAWRRELRLWRHLRWSLGLPLFAVVVLPWFVAVSLRNPDFARFFFIHEHLERYLTPVHRREGSLGYFVPYLLVGALPWTAALPWLLRARRADFASSLLVTWVGFVLVFFSLSDSKLPSYILPVFPALALLAARRFATTSTRGLALVLGVPAAIWACALIALPQTDRFFSAGTPAAAVDAMRTAIALAAVLFLAAAAWAALLLRQSRRHAAWRWWRRPTASRFSS